MKYGYVKENKAIYVGRTDGDNWYGRIEYDERGNRLTAAEMIAKHNLKPIITSPSFNGNFADYDFIEQDGKIVLGGLTDEAKTSKEQAEKDKLRKLRETQCFSYVNRGTAWYKRVVNTPTRQIMFDSWYDKWLNVTETLIIPDKLEWFD